MNRTSSDGHKKRSPGIKRIFAFSGALFLFICAVFLLWSKGVFLPGKRDWKDSSLIVDLDSDGVSETAEVKKGRLKIDSGGNELFISDPGWHIIEQSIFDIDHDGGPEVVLLLWKRGSFGSERPFWDQSNSFGFSRHIYILKMKDAEKIDPLWMSSDIGFAADSISSDADGRLIVSEASGETTVWEWQGFGLTLVSDDTENDPESSEASVSFIAAGDNIIHDSIYMQCMSSDGSSDFHPLYENVSDVISSADFAAVGQESVFTDDPEEYSSYPFFATPKEAGDALADTGFDIMLHASNHAADQGEKGIEDTLRFWKTGHPEIVVSGIYTVSDTLSERGEKTDSSSVSLSSLEEAPDRYEIVEKNGIRIAVFDYTYGMNVSLEEGSTYIVNDLSEDHAKDELIAGLKEAREKSDVSVCFLHMGAENTGVLTDKEENLLDEMIDAGANVIICAHAHILCPFEERKTESGRAALVYYGLGNFISHQRKPEQLVGGLASFTISKSENNDLTEIRIGPARLIPVVTHYSADKTAVYLLDDYTEELASEHFLNRTGETVTLEKLSQIFEERCENDSEIEILTRN